MARRVEILRRQIADEAPAFAHEFERSRDAYPLLFEDVGGELLAWAEAALGPTWPSQLVYGYCEFVADVNRSQLKYEKAGRYENSSFADVYARAYSNPEFMRLYHWGVYATTFVWKHHLRIYDFFEREFISLLSRKEGGCLVDLGCGSGVWHLLALKRLKNWNALAIDISAPTIELTKKMAASTSYENKIEHVVADALKFKSPRPAQAGISCFLMEHLEAPHALLAALAEALEIGAHAFVTSALTAAEVDHIYEFRHESEIILACEDAGFRVKAMLSSEPDVTPRDRYFLPRSIAMLLQKRRNPIW